MVVGPCAGFLIQAQEIHSTQKAEGFSQHACFILLMANLVRIFWWLAADFSATILYASVLMVFCQFVLLYVWVQAKARSFKG